MRPFNLLILIILFPAACLAQTGWVEVPSPIKGQLRSIQFFDDSNGYLLGDSNLFFTSDGGISWQKRSVPDAEMYNIHFLSKDTGFSITEKKLFVSSDGGSTWKNILLLFPTSKYYLLDFTFPTETVGYIRASSYDINTFIPYTTDRDMTWQMRVLDGSYDIASLAFSSSQTGLGVFNNAEPFDPFIQVTNDSAKTWSNQMTGITFGTLSADFPRVAHV
jgi:photosystem II stability/assembly factor-like uncharacterized protein